MIDPYPRRILWRCRRGTKELDLVLAGFLEQGYADLAQDDKTLFEEMLELQDTSLIEWLLYRQSPAPRYAGLVDKIIASSEDR